MKNTEAGNNLLTLTNMKTFREIFNKQCGFSCDDDTDRVQTTLSNIEKSAELYASQFHPSPKEISEEEIEKLIDALDDIFDNNTSPTNGGYGADYTHKGSVLSDFRNTLKTLSLPSSGSKTKAIEFAEWIERNNFVRVLKSKGLWLWHNPFYPDGIEIETVYQLFLKDKQQ